MIQFITTSRRRMVPVSKAAMLLLVFACCPFAWAENDFSEPIYRVAAETATAPTSAAAPAEAPAAAARPAFDLTRQPDEHELIPVIRALKASQEHIDQSIRDYSCTFVKRERIDGELGEFQNIFLKVAHQPFSVYLLFLTPFDGREVVYVDGQNENKMIVLDVGFKRYLGKVPLDPVGALAMKGQKRPITDVGIRNLTAKLIALWEAETKFAESEVTSNSGTTVEGRSTTMVQVVHPVPRQNFKAHVMRVFFDNELRVPIHFDAFLWPDKPGEKPPLDESYTYKNLKINNGFTARDFDPNNNPDIFKQ